MAKSTNASTHDALWLRYGATGALGAYRQLVGFRHRGGRKTVSLPGGKLQPLFKNHARPNSSQSRIGSPTVLPAISRSGSAEFKGSNMFRGSLDNLPEEAATSIRIYLCSNGLDMIDERNMIMTTAVPILQHCCSDLGLQFQLVDLHWCHRDGSHIDKFLKLAEDEIKDCQRLSIGPCFVGLLGDMYGRRCPPLTLPQEQFNLISEEIQRTKPNSVIMEDLYQISSTENQTYTLKEDLGDETLCQLSTAVLAACKNLVKENKLGEDDLAQYSMSVLDRQMTAGILKTPDARKHTLCYHREWRNIINCTGSEGISEYLECIVENNKLVPNVDNHAALRELSQRLVDHLGNASCKQYFLPWSDDGIAIKSKQMYSDYLNKMCEDFIEDVKHLILQGVREARKMKQTISSELSKEVLHHARIAQRNLQHFVLLDATTLNHVESFLRNNNLNSKLFVLYGPAGCGKTTMMAHIACNITSWFHEDCIVISRYLGSTAESSTIHSVVISITNQICLAYGMKTPSSSMQSSTMSTLYEALRVFREVLDSVSANHAAVRPLFIILDGINLLHPIDESLHSLWAIQSFPTNVYMIVSTATESGAIDIVGPLSAIVTGEECCKKMSDLTEEQTHEMMNIYCKQNAVNIDDRDAKYITDAAYTSKNILHLNLLCKQLKIRNFDDSSTVAEEQVDRSIREVFKQIIGSLEDKYGPLLVKYTLSFITLSPVGIAEGFLVDLITSDYPVMLEQDFFHNVPPEKTLLLSPRIWVELKNELRPYIEKGSAYGQTLLKWRHQEYSMVISEKYGVIFPGIQEECVTLNGTEFTLSLHESIVNFYIGAEKVKEGVDDHQLLVTPQLTNKSNISKLMRLPLHINILLPVEGMERMKSSMHFNLDWIQTKLEYISAQTVMQDVYTAAQLVAHFRNEGILEVEDSYGSLNDLDLMFEFWQLALPAMQQDGSLFVEILSRLSGSAQQWPNIKRLLEDVKEQIVKKQQPILYPVYPCSKTPGNISKHSLSGPTNFVDCIMNGRIAVMFSQQHGVDLWRLDAAELLHRFEVNREQSVNGVLVTSSGDFVLICHYSHLTHKMEVGVWSTHTGVEVIHSTFLHKFESVVLDPEDKFLIVSTVMDVDPVSDKINRCLLAVDILTRDVTHKIPVDGQAVHSDGISAMYVVGSLVPNNLALITIGSKITKDLAAWDIANEAMLYKVQLEFYVDLIKFCEKTKIAVCGSSALGNLVIIDLQTGDIIYSIQITGLVDMYLSKSSNHVLLATKCKGIIVMRLNDYSEVKTICLPKKIEELTKIAVDPYEQFIIVGYRSGLVSIYLIRSAEIISNLLEHQSIITGLFCWNQVQIVSVSLDGLTKTWYVKDLLKLNVTESQLTSWDDGKQFEQVVDENTNQSAVEKNTHSVAVDYPSQSENISAMITLPDNKRILTTSLENHIKLWNADTGSFIKEFDQHSVSEAYLAYKDQLLVGHCPIENEQDVLKLKVWNIADCKLVDMSKESQPEIVVYSSILLPKGDKLFMIGPSRKKHKKGIELSVFDLFEMKRVSSIHCNISGGMNATNLRLLGACQQLPPIEKKDEIEESEADTEKKPAEQKEDSPPGTPPTTKTYVALGYFPEKNTSYFFSFLLDGDDNPRIVMEHHQPSHFDTHNRKCTTSLDDGRAVSGTVDGSLLIWSMSTHLPHSSLSDAGLVLAISQGFMKSRSLSGRPAHDGMITCVRSVTSAGWLMSGGVDAKVKIWDYAKGTLLKVLSAHTRQIECIDLSAGCRILVSGGSDNRLIAWRVEDGEKLSVFHADDVVKDVMISPDVSKVAALYGHIKPKMAVLKLCNM